MADFKAPGRWTDLPPAHASDEDWTAFKRAAFDEMREHVRRADREFPNQPQARLERIHQLRREHHVIVVADRIRKSAAAPPGPSGPSLRDAAAFIVDRTAYVIEKRAGPRSAAEEKMMTSARVHWHKIMRQAQSPAGLQGGWATGRRELRGSTQIQKKLNSRRLTPDKRAELLRAYIEERLQQLVDLVRETTEVSRWTLPRQDRIIVQELENLLYRTQWPKRQKRGTAGQD